MSREFSVIVGIDASRARAGGREFKAGADQVTKSSQRMGRGLRTSQKRVIGLTTSLSSLRSVATLVFAGFLGVGGISSVIRTLSSFGSSMSQVKGLLGATTTTMETLTARAQDLGATTAFTATQAGEGMKFLALAGFDALEVFESIGPVLDLARAGMLNLGSAADITSNIMTTFQLTASDTSEVVDDLATISSSSNTNILQLSEAMKFGGQAANAFGLSVGTTAAAMGIMANAGLQGSIAGTSLSRALLQLGDPSSSAAKSLAKLGLSSQQLVKDLADPSKGLVSVMQQLIDAGVTGTAVFEIFGPRAGRAISALVNDAGGLEELIDSLKANTGAAKEMGEIFEDNLGGDAKIAVSALSNAIIELGKAGLTQFLRDTTQGFTGFIRGVTSTRTVTEGMSDVMAGAVATGTKLRSMIQTLGENFDTIRKVTIALVVVWKSQLIFAIAASTKALFVNAAAWVASRIALIQAAASISGTSVAMVVATTAATALTGALRFLVAAIPGAALLVGVGLLINWATSADTATTNTDLLGLSFKDAEKDLQTYVEKLVTAEEKVGKLSETTIELAAAQATIELAAAIQQQDKLNNAIEDGTAELAKNAVANAITLAEMDRLGLGSERIEEQAKDQEAAQKLLGAELVQLTGKLEGASGVVDNLALLMETLQLVATGAAASFTEAALQTGLYTTAAKDNAKAVAKAAKETENLKAATELAANQVENHNKGMQRSLDKLEDLANENNKTAIAQTAFRRGVRALSLELANLDITTEQFAERLEVLKDIYSVTLDQLCDDTDNATKCQEENAEKFSAAWDQATRNIQDAFADAFKGAFDSFGEFADRLLDAAKTLIAELLSAQLFGGLGDTLRGIFSGGIGGLAGSGPSATSGGSTGGFLANLATVGKTLLSAAGAFIEGVKTFFGAGSGSFGASGTPGLASSLGSGLAGAGVGFISGSVVDQVLGSRGDPGTTKTLSAIGGSIGGVFGGVFGAIIGGAIGSFVSNIFGGAKKLESATLEFSATAEGFNAVVESVVSKQRSFFRGRKFKTTRTDVDTANFEQALTAVVGQLTATAEALGVDAVAALADFDFSGELDIKGKSEEQLAALLEGLFNDVLTGVISEFVDNAEGLSDRLTQTVNSFRGNTEEFLRAFELAASIDLAFLVNPVTVVTDALAEQNKTLTDSYNELVTAYREVISEFDGSLPALEALAAATQIVVGAQIQLVAALTQAGQEISDLFQGSAQSIRESLLSEEELFNLRQSQIDALVAQVSTTTDPGELQTLAAEINRLGLDAFRLLDESQQGTLGDEFIEFFTGLEELFGDQIDIGLGAITEDNNALNQEVADAMTAAAQAQIDAAAETSAAARELQEAAIALRSGGGNFSNQELSV